MSLPAWHLAVLIPARNEEHLLPRCLRSIQRACVAVGADASTDVIVAADCCEDRTEQIARSLLATSGCVIRVHAGCVGVARALAAQTALQRFSGPLTRCWLANTDADCEVPEEWLLTQLESARGGCEALAGIIDVDSFADHGAEVPERFRATYLLHPDGTHPHVHGANLGVRADMYLRAGGFACLESAEDHDLWEKLLDAGARKRVSDARLRVLTSGRRLGRAPRGFASALTAHNVVRV